MSRADQAAISKTAQANSKEDQSNAEQQLAGFNSRLSAYDAADPYKPGGTYQTTQNTIAADSANADSNALQNELQGSGKRSGENTASFAPNLVAAQRQGVMDTATKEAQAETDRAGKETSYQQFGVGAQGSQVAPELSAANSSLGTANDAAKAPGFWDWFMQQAQQGAATGAKIAAPGTGA
jgi:hypothetical protein